MSNIKMPLPRDYASLSAHAKLLNRLVELQNLPEFAMHVNTLLDAEVTIYMLEALINKPIELQETKC